MAAVCAAGRRVGAAALKDKCPGNALEAEWLGLHDSIAGVESSIPGQGAKIQQAAQHGP